MFQVIIVFHVLFACCLIAVVLMQHGKGADAGVSLGSSASGSVFGSVGALPFMVKLTSALAVFFFATSLAIGYYTVHLKTSTAQTGVAALLTKQVKTAPLTAKEK